MKIIISLAIISLYVFLFGIMQTVDSIDSNIEAATAAATAPLRMAAPAVTTGVDESGRAVYTYATDLNVVNARKPGLADYSRTETALLILPEDAATTTAAETTAPADFVFSSDDLDFTLPPATTSAPATAADTTTTTTADTTTEPPAVTTAAPTAADPVPTEEEPEDEEVTEPAEDDTDIEDFTDEQDVTYITTTEEITEPEELDDPDDFPETTTTTAAAETTAAPPEVNTYTDNETFTVNAGGVIMTDTAVNIVATAVMAEIGDGFHEEAIKAQAIAAYTYIKMYSINNERAYIARRTPSEKIINLVKQVIGKAIYYNGQLIQAVYTASTAGRTASSKTVWGVDYPYLQSIDTGFIDKEYDINYGRKPTFSSEEIKNYVKKATGIVLTGDPSEWIKIDSYVDGVYVGQMTIGGYQTFNNGTREVRITGRVFRETIMDFDIRSACFDIEYDPSTDRFTITTYGYGHCVGLSQHGANILATYYGYDYEQILKFYYQGTEIR
ncbi:MAG: SpoIID/LytB domain-containing protein [Ruminiclostridium sp.]|nr:SpoIID/LytB domain-containing protein [Ruminiclostridium sp.]